MLGEIATARNPVVDRVELLAYNKARANNRAAVKRSETWLKNWNDAHGADAAAVAREVNARKRQAALVEFKAVSTRLKESRAHMSTVERSQLGIEWQNPWVRDAMVGGVCDLMHEAETDMHRAIVAADPKQCNEWIVSKYNVCKGLLVTERGVATKSRERVWQLVDAVTKNHAWLKNEEARIDSERNNVRATRAVLRGGLGADPQTDPDHEDTSAALRWCEQLVLSTEVCLKRLRAVTAAATARLKRLNEMSDRESRYLERLVARHGECDAAIARLRRGGASAGGAGGGGGGGGGNDDDDGEVEVVSEKTWAQRDAEARAAAVQID